MDRKRFRVTTAKAQANTASVGLRAERVVAIDEFAIKRECRAAALRELLRRGLASVEARRPLNEEPRPSGLDGRGPRRPEGVG
jgi:hypothetical protein